MKVIITGRNIELTPSLKEFVEKKMDSIKSYVEQLQEIDVILSVDKTKSAGIQHVAEVTIWAKGMNFRASSHHQDMYAAIDLIIDKLQKQTSRYKEKLKSRGNRKSRYQQDFQFHHHVLEPEFEPVVLNDDHEEAPKPKIVRSNMFFSKPMHTDEAADQLEYLGQEFIVFNNAETGDVNVIYRRNDGNIGLIEPNK